MKSIKMFFNLLDFSVVAFLVFIVLMMFFWGCKHEPMLIPVSTADNTSNGGGTDTTVYPETSCDPDTAYFENTILPLFISNCAKSGCHDATTHSEGLILNSYANIMNSGEITPGQPSQGKIMEVITTSEPDDVMPPAPNTPLTQDQINLISTWISQGASDNSCSGCDTLSVTYSGTVKPLLQTKCVGCHNTSTASGNINLSAYSGAQQQALNGHLLGSVNHDAGYSAMPKGGSKLPQCEIDELRIWIEEGAPNN